MARTSPENQRGYLYTSPLYTSPALRVAQDWIGAPGVVDFQTAPELPRSGNARPGCLVGQACRVSRASYRSCARC